MRLWTTGSQSAGNAAKELPGVTAAEGNHSPDAEQLTPTPGEDPSYPGAGPLTPVDLPLDGIRVFPYAVYALSYAVDVTWTAVYVT